MIVAPAPIRFPWRWLLVGFVAYLIFLLMTFPATRAAPFLQRSGIAVAGVSGTLWNGRAGFVQVRGFSLGATQWELHPLQVVTGKLAATVETKTTDGFVNANVAMGFGGTIEIQNLRGSLPLTTFAALPLPGGGVNGWSGTLQLEIAELELVKQWPALLDGSATIANLVGPPRQPASLGSYRVDFGRAEGSEILGTVSSLEDAPLDVVGTLRLGIDRSYSVDAQVGTRRTAPAQIVKAIEYLGIPDAEGRRPLSIAGTL